MDDLFGLIVIIIGIAAGIYSDKKKKEGVQKKAAVPNQPGGGRKNVPQTQVSYGGHAGRPDIIADAAKAMNYLASREGMLEKAYFVAIPTTSGTGSEVTTFAPWRSGL